MSAEWTAHRRNVNRLTQIAFGVSLSDWVRLRRSDPTRPSWAALADALEGAGVYVSADQLRRWHPQPE